MTAAADEVRVGVGRLHAFVASTFAAAGCSDGRGPSAALPASRAVGLPPDDPRMPAGPG